MNKQVQTTYVFTNWCSKQLFLQAYYYDIKRPDTIRKVSDIIRTEKSVEIGKDLCKKLYILLGNYSVVK